MLVRRASYAALVGGIVLLPVGIGAAGAAHSSASSALSGALANRATAQTQLLDDYFSRARSINLITANNPALGDIFTLPGDRMERIKQGGPTVDRANDALAYLEELFPDSIGEVCVIDRTGTEAARVVRGERAAVEDLSDEEAKAPFFRPTFGSSAGTVYQAEPYISPDTDEWVISNSTLLPSDVGAKVAIAHYEITIESFRRTAEAGSQFQVLVVDAKTGAVVIDSRHPQPAGPDSVLGRPDDLRFQALTAHDTDNGELEIDGKRAAFRHLQHVPGNANDWYVVTLAADAVGPLYGIGSWPIAIVIASLLLICGSALGLRVSQRDLVAAATTDHLTGLGNRRKLRQDLRSALRTSTETSPTLLLMFDLNGFKDYNDTYGHSAGDALLARLGQALRAAVAGRGQAYRLGGDEFCVLAPIGSDGSEPTIAAASAALAERGDGFAIDASYGAVLLPIESCDAAEAMHIVDQRMYAQKTSGRRSADRQTKDVLLTALCERHPELSDRFRAVAGLADAVADRMGLRGEDRHLVRQAAELHDIGKVAIPDEILDKDAPLTDDEWEFVRRHSAIGERILGAAPALSYAARLVRSANEWFDGTGYPDRLAGEAIPLGSRIIAVCDAYVAMTSKRSYAPAMSTAQALAELRRCARTQFDPQVVAVFVGVVNTIDNVDMRFEAIVRDYESRS
jgi:diguanylate cyclase (GGDEF)-like protein